MSDFLFGFMLGMFATLLGAMLPPRRRRFSPNSGAIRRGPAPLRRPQQTFAELLMPPPAAPPQQPLTADPIRYEQWRDEQVRQALKNDTTPPPPGDTP